MTEFIAALLLVAIGNAYCSAPALSNAQFIQFMSAQNDLRLILGFSRSRS